MKLPLSGTVLLALILLQNNIVTSLIAPMCTFQLGQAQLPTTRFHCKARVLRQSCLFSSRQKDIEEDEEWWEEVDLEVLEADGDELGNSEEDWMPDAARAKKKPKHLTPANEVIPQRTTKSKKQKSASSKTESERPTPYTEDEEEIIYAMGGKQKARKREQGFMGDSTIAEIATDYSVPICYLADVLCMWGVPVPINIQDRLGDLVTGEQAFALVEAVNSLDVGALQDRYSNQNLLLMCDEWDIDLKDAFAFALKEGWNLPFGVRTNLRVEQEEELMRIYSRFYQE